MNVVIIGATSSIAQETARRYADSGARIVLVARDRKRVEAVGDDLVARGAASVDTLQYDLADTKEHAQIDRSAHEILGTVDLVLIAHGTLPEQSACQDDYAQIEEIVQLNALSVISLCVVFSARLQHQGGGTLAVISSVAGDRGRQSNYVYGTAKAAVTTFCSGLRARMRNHGVQVLTIKPGMVDTPMTAHMPKGPLFSTPDRVAQDIESAVAKGRDVLYTPFFWRYIMLVITLVPEFVFKRLKF